MTKIQLESFLFLLAFVIMLAKMFAGYPIALQNYMQMGFYCLIAFGLILGATRQTEKWRKYTLFVCSAVLISSVLQIPNIPHLMYSAALLIGVISNKRHRLPEE